MGCVPRFLSFRRTNRSGCNEYEIIISPTVFLPDVPSDIRRGIIMHELLHTVRGCAGKHGKTFRKYAALAEHDGDTAYHIRDHFSPYFLEHWSEPDGMVSVCPECGSRCIRKLSEARQLYQNGLINSTGHTTANHFYSCAECGGMHYQAEVLLPLQEA